MMAKVVSPITARVEVIGKPKESNYTSGQFYYPTLFIDLGQPDGSEEAKIWKSLSGDEVTQVIKGDVVQLVPAGKDRSGKDKHSIVVIQPAAPRQSVASAQPQTQSTGLDIDTKKAIAAFIDGQADLYRFCLTTAQTKLDGLIGSEEGIRTVATTLYLGAVRKFGLDLKGNR
jgi:hypothetical protein